MLVEQRFPTKLLEEFVGPPHQLVRPPFSRRGSAADQAPPNARPCRVTNAYRACGDESVALPSTGRRT